MKKIIEQEINGGTQRVFKAENGYGASVICHDFSYGGPNGKFELAVIEFDGDEWELCYDTPITGDVVGHLSETDVCEILEQIEGL